jgi:hypothetical protein
MADPIPVNSRRDRNPPVPPRPNPFPLQAGGARPNGFAGGGGLGGAVGQRPAPFNNAALGGAERARADAAVNRPVNPPVNLPRFGAQQQARDGGIFDRANARRAARRQRQGLTAETRDRLERVMFVVVVVVMALLMLLSSRTAPPPSSVTPYAPRDVSTVQVVPTTIAQPVTSATLALIPAYTRRRDLVRTCPRAECVPISDQPVIENDTGVFARGQSVDGLWIAISAVDLRWNGWVAADMMRLTQPGAALPVLPG